MSATRKEQLLHLHHGRAIGYKPRGRFEQVIVDKGTHLLAAGRRHQGDNAEGCNQIESASAVENRFREVWPAIEPISTKR